MSTGAVDPGALVASVSTHILDTSVGRPAAGVAVRLAARTGRDADWRALGGSAYFGAPEAPPLVVDEAIAASAAPFTPFVPEPLRLELSA